MNEFLETYKCLELLTPYDVDELEKIRIGSENNGSYILLNDFSDIAGVFSFGISNDPFFDIACANRGYEVYMFDHTIDQVDGMTDRMHFMKEGVAHFDDSSASLFTIETHMLRQNLPSSDYILKIDIEGGEWDIFENIPRETLLNFRQITGEFHWTSQLNDSNFRKKFTNVLNKLRNDYILFHIHANNCVGINIINGFPVPDVFEVSFIRKDRVRHFSRSKSVFPTKFDSAINQLKPDLPLWFFPFMPLESNSIDMSEFMALKAENLALHFELQKLKHGVI